MIKRNISFGLSHAQEYRSPAGQGEEAAIARLMGKKPALRKYNTASGLPRFPPIFLTIFDQSHADAAPTN
ncbi:hypothetical protein [Janthinobacterium sp.]|uniref:hypothetical protein n=1 Tax=Janthinobacterium sp. TaxID=1871054 RepID=UPI00289D38D3|nr:hypothetical protein [Janthinobacterium sp.]